MHFLEYINKNKYIITITWKNEEKMRILPILCLAGLTLSLASAEVEAEHLPAPAPHAHEALLGARIQRTMTLLETSTRDWKRKVKIIGYGQSIIQQQWTGAIAKALQERYPEAKIEFSNRAIGGFGAASLIRTAQYDLYQEYPDLVIFHVYGGEWNGELERIFYNLRKYTTAEIITYTHHIDRQENLEKVATSRATASARQTEYLAQKYNCELVDVRNEWIEYIRKNNIKQTDLLRDSVHLNEEGNRLMFQLFMRHFRYNTLYPSDWSIRVRDYEGRRFLEEASDEIILEGDGWIVRDGGIVSTQKGDKLTLKFTGNRVDVIDLVLNEKTGPIGLGAAQIRIDGKAPSSFPAAYYVKRPSTAHKLWWPALKRVTLNGLPRFESWEMEIREVNADSSKFKFRLRGSVTGEDGEGIGGEKFTSLSGRITIFPDDYTGIKDAARVSKEQCPENFKVTWEIGGRFTDRWEPANGDRKVESTTLLIQGIDNAEHTLEIISEGTGMLPLRGIRVHTPPLR